MKNPTHNKSILFAWIILVGLASASVHAASVILYCSQDQVFAEPLLKEFEKESGIKVKAVYDSEALKTASLANRLRAESSNPRCDVFWSNEELLAKTLAAEGLVKIVDGQGPSGSRARVIVVSSDLPGNSTPHSFQELTNSNYSGKVAMAYPVYGTTAHHFAQLRDVWGDARWSNWCEALRGNKLRVVDGNSMVVRLVASGQIMAGMTDTDDVRAVIAEGWKVKAILPVQDGLCIRNTVAVLREAPHQEEAAKLGRFLCSSGVAAKLVRAGALDAENSLAKPTDDSRWKEILREWPDTRARLEKGFAR